MLTRVSAEDSVCEIGPPEDFLIHFHHNRHRYRAPTFVLTFGRGHDTIGDNPIRRQAFDFKHPCHDDEWYTTEEAQSVLH